MQLFVHRNEPNRPHISSDTIDFKERRDKINTKRHFNLGATCVTYLCLLSADLPSEASLPQSVPRPASTSAPPVKGYLLLHPKPRNPFLSPTSHFF